MARRNFIRYVVVSICTFGVGSAAVFDWFQIRRSEQKAGVNGVPCVFDFKSAEGQPFFPQGAFLNRQTSDDGIAQYRSNVLAEMNEPSVLLLPACVDEAYRFLWLRSFRTPVAIRIWRVSDKYRLVSKQSNVNGQNEFSVNRELTRAEWESVLELLRKASFWDMPTLKEPFGGNDGADWVLEGSKAGHYHVVDRWSPSDRSYRAACVFIARISGLPIKEMDFEGF